MENRAQTMAAGEFEFGFAVNWMRKDLDIALSEARAVGARLPLTALVDQFYGDVQAMGGAVGYLELDSAAAGVTRVETPCERRFQSLAKPSVGGGLPVRSIGNAAIGLRGDVVAHRPVVGISAPMIEAS